MLLDVQNMFGENEEFVYRYHDAEFAKNYGVEPRIIVPKKRRKHYKVDYGYAITCHASQGSEWDSVLVYDDDMYFANKMDKKKWQYTAITRAKKKLTYITK